MDKETLTKAKARFDQSAERFYRSGAGYLTALDALIETRAGELGRSNGGSKSGNGNREVALAGAPDIGVELRDLRAHKEDTEELLRRLFPDEFADTCSGAE
ncbi:MAG TPA: hypothetical protein VIG62_09165 [Blastocatellia bacterium]|jgi:hypothetical protein